MRRHWLVLVRALAITLLSMMTLLGARAALAADAVVLRLTLEPSQGILVGQQVRINLDLLGRDGWASLATPPRLELAGAWLMRIESQGTRLSETIDGDSYSGQRYQWLLFPQRAGAFKLPPLSVEVAVKDFAANGDAAALTLTTPALQFTATAPPGTQDIAGLITTSELSASQQWQPDSDALSTGNGIRRQITLRAAGIAAMAFSPLTHADIDGVALYPGEPQVQDRVNRGTLESGERIDTITYVPEHAGSYQLPDITIRWWDPDSQQLRQQTLPGRSLSVSAVAATDGTTTVRSTSAAGTGWRPLGIALVLAVLVSAAALLAWGWGRYGKARWVQRQQRRQHSEAAVFQRFVDAANSADVVDTTNALMPWLDRIERARPLDLAGQPARLDQFMAR